MSERAARWGLLIIVAAYLVIGGVYSLLAPLGEAPDEMAHMQYMRYIAEERHLPQTEEEREAVGLKSHEPPLYYVLTALVTAPVDVQALPQLKQLDPDRYPRHSLPDEVLINFSPLHTADEVWPFRGIVLAWHVARLFSLALMAATLFVLYRVARQVCPKRPEVALLATAVAALTPQFVYIGSSVNNDALAALLGALVLWALVGLAQGDVRWRRFLLLGVLLGLGRLTKFYMLALLPETVLVLLVLAWRQRQPRYAVGLLPALALSFAIPLPWLLYIQPVDPAVTRGWGRLLVLLDVVHTERWFTAGGEGQAGAGTLAVGRALVDVLRLQPLAWAVTLFRSFWGLFGAMTLEAPRPLYAVAAGLSGLAALGWLRGLARRLRGRATVFSECQHLWIPILQALAFLGTEAVFYGVMQRLPDTAQARHLYPALAGLALVLAVGWWSLWPRLSSAPAVAGLAVLMAGLSVYCLPTILMTEHKPLLPVRSTPWPDAPVEALQAPLGDGVVLLGARWDTATPGQLHGTLYWQAAQPPTTEAIASLELLDPAGTVCAVWAGHPGGSRYPTQAWSAGDYVRQDLDWPLPASLAAGPYTLRLQVLRDGQAPVEAPATQLDLPAAPATEAMDEPLCRVYGVDPATVNLRDTVLVTWPEGGLQGFRGADGALWEPVARTARGDQMALVADARVQPGSYTLQAVGLQPGPCATVTVAGRARRFDLPADLEPCGALFGGAVELAGYRLDNGATAEVAPGSTVHLRLVWRAQTWVPEHYTVFTHLIDAEGTVWGQQDKLPGEGYSTLFWAPGEVVVDDYALAVKPDAPTGTYRLRVGLYQALSGVRAQVDLGGEPQGDSLLLGEVEVRPQ